MNAGKTLRFRRIFRNGRALIVGPGPLGDDPVQKVRHAARAGLDAVVLTPGLLDPVLEELGALSVILRLDGGPALRQFLSVQSALIMGADAALIDMTPDGGMLAGVSEEARRVGMPLFVNIGDADFAGSARLAADFGADVIVTRGFAGGAGYRQISRSTGRPCLPEAGQVVDSIDLLSAVSDALEAGALGLMLGHESLLEPRILGTLLALVHQGVSAEEAVSLARQSARERQ